MTKRVREQSNLRDAAGKAYVEAKTDASFKVYRKQHNKAGHVQRKARMANETNLATSAAVNPKKLFGHIQQDKHLEHKIFTLKNEDGLRVTNLSPQADLFAEVFYRTFRPDTPTPVPEFFEETQPMPPMVFTSDSVMKILQSLSPHKAAGPGELHPKILRALALFIAEPLSELFNL